jgi:hypothetical protein
MVSVLIKSGDYIVLFAKTHHLKTLYIMPESMAGKTVCPTEFLLVGTDKIRDPLVVDGLGRVSFLREEPVPGTFIHREGIPVLEDQFPGIIRKLRITVRAVLRSADMDTSSGMFNIGTFQVSYFADAEPCGKHQTKKCFKFKVRNRSKKCLHFFPRRNKRDIRIKLAEGKLVRIPWFVEDIQGKETQLRDTGIYSAVRKAACLLEPGDEIPQFLPGYFLRRSMNDIRKILKICRDIR